MNDFAAIDELRRHGDRPAAERTFRIGPHLLLEMAAVPGHGDGLALAALREPVLVWIASGRAVAEFAAADGAARRVSLRQGEICLAATPLAIRLRRDGTDVPCKAMWLQVGLPLLARTAQDIHGKPTADVTLRDAAGQADDTLATLLALMHAVLKRPVPPCAQFMHGMGQALAAHLVRRYAADGRGPAALQGLPPHKLQRVLCAMRESLDEPFNLEDLARQAELSVCHFSRSFKLATGLSPSRYFVQLRIEEARRLLCESAQPVIDVALALGYRSPSHFAQVFREWTGVSPTAYRAGAAGRQRWHPSAVIPPGGATR